MTPRKKYRITADGIQVGETFRSEASAYGWLQQYVAGGATGAVTVWVDERHGHGWQRFEDVDLTYLRARR